MADDGRNSAIPQELPQRLAASIGGGGGREANIGSGGAGGSLYAEDVAQMEDVHGQAMHGLVVCQRTLSVGCPTVSSRTASVTNTNLTYT